jgi:hypothetical protein
MKAQVVGSYGELCDVVIKTILAPCRLTTSLNSSAHLGNKKTTLTLKTASTPALRDAGAPEGPRFMTPVGRSMEADASGILLLPGNASRSSGERLWGSEAGCTFGR